MKNKWRILKILVTVMILGFLLSFSLKRFNNKPLENISVKMTSATPVYFLSEEDVKNIAKKNNPEGKIGSVNIPALEKKINALPAVDSANVYLNLNGNLHLDVRQRVPAFRLQKGEKDFYVDDSGVAFPTSANYSFPCMLVTGNVKQDEYLPLVSLVKTIDADDFSKKYFVGIAKNGDNYNLLTADGNYKVEIGDLENIKFKVKGFKTFVEKFLVYQDPAKYSKISVKYDNQIVTTLNPGFKANDSIISSGKKALEKLPQKTTVAAKPAAVKNPEPAKKQEKPKAKTAEKPKEKPKAKETAKPAEKKKAEKKPAEVKKAVPAKKQAKPSETKKKK